MVMLAILPSAFTVNQLPAAFSSNIQQQHSAAATLSDDCIAINLSRCVEDPASGGERVSEVALVGNYIFLI